MLKQSEILEKVNDKIKAEGIELSKVAVEKIIKSYNEILKEDLITTGKTKVVGIGNVEIRYRAEREGRNPRTKEKIVIEECLTAGLAVSSTLKKELADNVDIADYRK